jgi:hypothetical protein
MVLFLTIFIPVLFVVFILGASYSSKKKSKAPKDPGPQE